MCIKVKESKQQLATFASLRFGDLFKRQYGNDFSTKVFVKLNEILNTTDCRTLNTIMLPEGQLFYISAVEYVIPKVGVLDVADIEVNE